MAAPKKPVEAKVRERPQRAVVELVPNAPAQVPADPGWLPETVAAYEAYRSSDVAGAVDGADEHGLARLFGMRDAQARAFARWRADPYLDGSQGQPVANPAFNEAMTLERAIVALEDRLGLSPKARASLGIAIGQARMTAADLNRRVTSDSDNIAAIVEAEGWEAG